MERVSSITATRDCGAHSVHCQLLRQLLPVNNWDSQITTVSNYDFYETRNHYMYYTIHIDRLKSFPLYFRISRIYIAIDTFLHEWSQ